MPNSGNLNTGSAAERHLRARIAANTRWAFESDRSAATAPARRGLDAKFEQIVDPDGVLEPAERALRAEAARRAHFLRMAAKSAAVRRARRAPPPAAKPHGPDAA